MKTIALACLAIGTAFAQHDHAAGASGEKPVALYQGLGNWRHPIRTRNAEAQKFFNQGLNLLYGFNRHEAMRSFRKAAELDPDAAMAYWGLAMAWGPYVNMDGDPTFDLKESCAAAAKGLAVKGAPANERAYLDAAAKRCPEYQPQTYIDAMKALAASMPDDPDALTFYADALMIPPRWHWYTADGTPAAGVAEAERVLEGVLRRWPLHPGANHMYIHAVESSPTPERAVASAQRLMGIVPAAGHMVHMPGHIWLVLGDWDMAGAVNERAVAVDQKYFADTKVSGSYSMYYIHNLHFVAYARWMQGRKTDGMRAADDMAKAVAPLGAVKEMAEMADAFTAVTSFARVRFNDWDAILKAPQPNAEMPASTMVWRYSRAVALAARGDRAGAVKEQAAFDEMRKSVPAEAPWGNNKAAQVLAIASEVIAARVAAQPAEAVEHWKKAVTMQDALTYDEPPAWYYPLRESLGAALLRAGHAAEGEAVFREGVRRSPRNGRMLFGLMESLKAQGKTEEAEWVRKEYESAWAKADIKLRLEDL
jgi:tetratricopeptide (TPR) repeat protein